eukprot:5053476-Alexandrium_andersonii.AAC.1
MAGPRGSSHAAGPGRLRERPSLSASPCPATTPRLARRTRGLRTSACAPLRRSKRLQEWGDPRRPTSGPSGSRTMARDARSAPW